MGGGGVIIILKRIVNDSLTVGITPSGRWKLWHALVLTHLLAFIAGLVV